MFAGSVSPPAAIECLSAMDGTLVRILEGHTGSVNALFVGHDGCVYSGSCDCTVRVWSGRQIRTLNGHDQTSTVTAVIISVHD
eukprot:m.202003 g.202003  ORF g.202003 m.202003 type:complete len:83 (+) comp15354_c0_seq9:227-475(+)